MPGLLVVYWSTEMSPRRFPISIAAVTFAVIASLASAFAVDRQALEEVLDRASERPPLLTFAGVKPVSSEFLELPKSPRPSPEDLYRWETLLLTAQSDGTLAASDLIIWRARSDGTRMGTALDPIHFMNRKAIARLIRDPEVQRLFKQERITLPESVDQAVELYKMAVVREGYRVTGPKWANLVVGVFLGFPPADVLEYAEETQRMQRLKDPASAPLKQRTLVSFKELVNAPHLTEGLELGAYAEFQPLTQSRQARKKELGAAAKAALQNYWKLRKRGMSNLEILNSMTLLEASPRRACLLEMLQRLTAK